MYGFSVRKQELTKSPEPPTFYLAVTEECISEDRAVEAWNWSRTSIKCRGKAAWYLSHHATSYFGAGV